MTRRHGFDHFERKTFKETQHTAANPLRMLAVLGTVIDHIS